jgi:MFS family permease
VKAVLLGLLVDIGGTLIGTLLFAAIYGAMLASGGTSPAEAQEAYAEMAQTAWGFTILAVMGCGFSVLGGYVCARISRRLDFRLGLILAALSAGSGFLLGGGGEPPLKTLLMMGVTVACVLTGTWYGIRRNAA